MFIYLPEAAAEEPDGGEETDKRAIRSIHELVQLK